MAEKLREEWGFGMCLLAADLIPPLSSPTSRSSRRGRRLWWVMELCSMVRREGRGRNTLPLILCLLPSWAVMRRYMTETGCDESRDAAGGLGGNPTACFLPGTNPGSTKRLMLGRLTPWKAGSLLPAGLDASALCRKSHRCIYMQRVGIGKPALSECWKRSPSVLGTARSSSDGCTLPLLVPFLLLAPSLLVQWKQMCLPFTVFVIKLQLSMLNHSAAWTTQSEIPCCPFGRERKPR